jgi:hypothetical protein
MTKNDSSTAWNGRAKQRALDSYAQLVPVAKNTYAQMVPMAKNTYAQMVPMARQRADVIVAWANPRVRGARVWAAPRVEQAGIAVREQIAPAVSAALIEASRRLDDSPPKRSRWPWVLAGIGLLAAAGSAAAAILLKRRPASETFGAEDEMTADSATAGTDYAQPADEAARSQDNGGVDMEESAANGRMRTS